MTTRRNFLNHVKEITSIDILNNLTSSINKATNEKELLISKAIYNECYIYECKEKYENVLIRNLHDELFMERKTILKNFSHGLKNLIKEERDNKIKEKQIKNGNDNICLICQDIIIIIKNRKMQTCITCKISYHLECFKKYSSLNDETIIKCPHCRCEFFNPL